MWFLFSSTAASLNKCSTHGAGGGCADRSGPGPCVPCPVLTDRSGQRGPGWEATAAGGEREGAAVGASPGLALPLDRASPEHPRGTGDAAAPPRRGVGLGTMLHGECSLILNYGQYLER